MSYEKHLEDKVEKYEKFLMHLYCSTPHKWLRTDLNRLLGLGPAEEKIRSSGGSTAKDTGT